MKYNIIIGFLILNQLAFGQNTKKERTLLWAEHFNVDGKPDSTKFGYDIGGHGWGNNEKQNYTSDPKNAYVKNGMLHIVSILEGKEITSARLVTKNKVDLKYGRIEVSAKLPKGLGTWPAIWMLPSQQSYGNQFWPDNGEIDIMEHVGYDPNVVHGNVHTKAYNHVIGTNKGNRMNVNTATSDFNVYAIEWTKDKIDFFINNQKYFTFSRNGDWQKWPFDQPFHLILNMAIGGNWGGQKGIDYEMFPQEFLIDYIKIYK